MNFYELLSDHISRGDDVAKELKAYLNDSSHLAIRSLLSEIIASGSLEALKNLPAMGMKPSLVSEIKKIFDELSALAPKEKTKKEEGEKEKEKNKPHGPHLGEEKKEQEPETVLGDKMKSDKTYQEILQTQAKETNESGKKLSQEEKEKEAERIFREKHPQVAAQYDKDEETLVYERVNEDPLYKNTQQAIEGETDKAYEELKKKNPQADKNSIKKQVSDKKWVEFVSRYEQKAEAYALKNPQIEEALAKTFGEKIYDDHSKDPLYRIAVKKAEQKAARKIAFSPILGDEQKEKIRSYEREQELYIFARKFPKKLAKYQQKNPELAKAHQRIQEEDAEREHKKQEPPQIPRKLIQELLTEEPAAAEFPQPPAEPPAQPQPPSPSPNQPGALPEPPARTPPTPNPSQLRALQGLGRLASLGRGFAAIPYLVPILVFLLVFIVIVIIIILIAQGLEEDKKNFVIKGLTLKKAGPSKVENGVDIPYSINAEYFGTEDVVVEDKIPQNTEFVSASGNYATESGVVRWRLKDNGGETGGSSIRAETTEFPESVYRGYGFPAVTQPEGMTPTQVTQWKTYLMPSAIQAGQLLQVDPALIGMWAWIETGFQTYASNCNDLVKNDPNYYCPSGLWQVGYGAQVYDHLKNLSEAFAAMHQGESVQQVGQKVITDSTLRGINGPITQPSATFPDISIDELAQRAQSGDQNSRMYAAILMKDDAIGAYLIAKTFRAILGPNLAKTMQGWSPSFYDPQKIMNYIAGMYKSGIAQSSERQIGIVKRFSFSLVLHPTKDDIEVTNTATARVFGSTSTAAEESSPSANNDTCGGKYKLNNPFGNFGDPTCSFTKDDLYTLLKAQDPILADKWFTVIVPCESQYVPNAYLKASASGLGAYGLFQMNPKGQGNGQFDAGNVFWREQIVNAIQYNKSIGGSFRYWACNR